MFLRVLVMQVDVQLPILIAAESASKFKEFASAVGVEVVVAHENCRIGALSFSSLNLVLIHGRCLSLKALLDFFGCLYLGGLHGLYLACCHYLSLCLIYDLRMPLYCAISHFTFLTFLGNLTFVTGMTT